MQYLMFVIGIIIAGLLFRCFLKDNKKSKRKTIYNIVIYSLLISVILEIAVFNFRTFEFVRGDCAQNTVKLNTYKNVIGENNQVNILKTQEGYMYTITLSNIGSKVKNIDVAPNTQSNILNCTLKYADEVQPVLTTVTKGDVALLSGDNNYNHMVTTFAGKVSQLQFVITSKSAMDSVTIKLNYPAGFDFNVVRYVVVALVLMLLMLAVAYKGRKEMLFEGDGRAKLCLTVFAVAQIIAVTVLIFAINTDTTTTTKNSDFKIFAETTDYNDPYHEMAIAFSKGQLNLNGINPATAQKEKSDIQKIESLDNKYSNSARTGLNFKWDHVLYNGKYYSYFGVVPEVLSFLPVYRITGHQLNTKFVSYVYAVLIIILMTMFVYKMAKRWQDKLNIPVVVSAAAALVNGSAFLCVTLLGRFYELAVLSAICFSMLGINLILEACKTDKINNVKLCIGALSMALAVGCRPNFALISFIALPIIILALMKQSQKNGNWISKIFNKNNIKSIILFAMPYIVVGAGLMLYNYARFDSFTEFGAKYQLTVYDASYYSIMDFNKVIILIGQCLLMMPMFLNRFPFINAVSGSPECMGYYYQEEYYGVFANPFNWALVMLPWSLKRGIKKSGLRGFVIVTAAVALLMSYTTIALGGMILRYMSDYSWLFLIIAVLVVFDLYGAACRKNIAKYATMCIVALAIITVIINLLIGISSFYYGSGFKAHNPEFYYWLEQTISFWRV